MHDVNFILREPLLDAALRIRGYELSWQNADGYLSQPSEADLQSMAQAVAERFNHAERGYLMNGMTVFIGATPETVRSGVLEALSPEGTVLTIQRSDLGEASALEDIQSARASGFGVLLRDADLLAADSKLLPLVSAIELRYGSDNFAANAQSMTSLRRIARGVHDWSHFDACAALGLETFIGNLYLTTRPGTQSKSVNPGQAMILQLMDMVRKNADVRQLEGVLKRDAGLSYKLLRYINSAGFGLGTEIQSLRHAVTMLGYSPLYRWLSVLLASASTNANAAVLMHTAVVRGRFAELLGQSFLPKAEADNLFVAGMFSLLDRLLGMPMEDVLDNIQLSESVSQALLSREGIYGPFLALAEACERENGRVGPLADALFISASQVNEAHLAALAWAQGVMV